MVSKVITYGIIGVVAVGTIGFGVSHVAGNKTEKVVTVGIVGTADNDLWKIAADTAKEKYNITLKTKQFTDYNQPNIALKNGSIDLNAYQNQVFLRNWNKANGHALKLIGRTVFTPLRFYDKNASKVSEVKDGQTIAVPNDATNEGRALQLLQSAGLIKIKAGVDLPTLKDIVENKKHLVIKEVAADQTPAAYKSAGAAVINTNFAKDAKIDLQPAIYVEPVTSTSNKWYIQFAATNKNVNKKLYKEVVKSFQTAKAEKWLEKTWGDAEQPAWTLK